MSGRNSAASQTSRPSLLDPLRVESKFGTRSSRLYVSDCSSGLWCGTENRKYVTKSFISIVMTHVDERTDGQTYERYTDTDRHAEQITNISSSSLLAANIKKEIPYFCKFGGLDSVVPGRLVCRSVRGEMWCDESFLRRGAEFGVVVDLEDLNEIMTDSGFVLRIRKCCLCVMNSVWCGLWGLIHRAGSFNIGFLVGIKVTAFFIWNIECSKITASFPYHSTMANVHTTRSPTRVSCSLFDMFCVWTLNSLSRFWSLQSFPKYPGVKMSMSY